MVLVHAARTGRAFPSAWASPHCESMASRWAVPAETPCFQAKRQAFELAFAFLAAVARNALFPDPTCWITVAARMEQDAPCGKMGAALAINSRCAGTRSPCAEQAASGFLPHHSLSATCDALTTRVQCCAFVSVRYGLCARRVGHNFFTS